MFRNDPSYVGLLFIYPPKIYTKQTDNLLPRDDRDLIEKNKKEVGYKGAGPDAYFYKSDLTLLKGEKQISP